MTFHPLTLLAALLLLAQLTGCGTDTRTTDDLSSSNGQAHYSGLYIDGNDNPGNRAQYMGYSLKGTVNVGGNGNGTSPPPAYTTVDYSITCLSCHPGEDAKANAAILKQYAVSGHADVAAVPWTIPEVGSSCQRCHTTFGFLYHLENYGPANFDPSNPLPFFGITLSSPNYTGNNKWTGTVQSTPINQLEEYRKAMQVLICSACHPENGLVAGTLRTSATPGGFVALWSANNITARVAFPDAGASNLCIRCHSARRAGPNITEVATTTAHYLPAAATIFSGSRNLVNIIANTTATSLIPATETTPEIPATPVIPPFVDSKFTGLGYEFPGQHYESNLFSHKNVGTPGGKGPCVGCHMSGSVGHSMKVVTEDTGGNITAINSSATCSGCHGDDLSPSWLNGKKAGFLAAVRSLDELLQSKGFHINPENGTFYKDAAFSILLSADAVSLGITTTAATKKYYDDQAATFGLDKGQLRGAAFNLWLYRYKGGDPASYVHNSDYTKKILFDTLDYLDNGRLDGTISLSDPLAAAYLDGESTVAGVQRLPSALPGPE